MKKYEESIVRGRDSHSTHLMKLLETRINLCRHTLKELQDAISKLDPGMMEVYIKLVSILRSLSACNTRSRVG